MSRDRGQFISRYIDGDRDFTEECWDNADLSNLDLTDADFEDADLDGANLSGCTLNNTDFTDASLRGTNFNNTKGMLIRTFLFHNKHNSLFINGQIHLGCECHSPQWWIENCKAMGISHGYTAEETAEYLGFFTKCKYLLENFNPEPVKAAWEPKIGDFMRERRFTETPHDIIGVEYIFGSTIRDGSIRFLAVNFKGEVRLATAEILKHEFKFSNSKFDFHSMLTLA